MEKTRGRAAASTELKQQNQPKAAQIAETT